MRTRRASAGGAGQADPAAFAELYRRYLPRVYGFAFRRTGSVEAAEDVTSAAFERALRNLGSFAWRPGGFGPWLFRIVANELVDHHRRAGRAASPRSSRGGRPAQRRRAPRSGRRRRHPRCRRELRAAMDRLSPRYQRAGAALLRRDVRGRGGDRAGHLQGDDGRGRPPGDARAAPRARDGGPVVSRDVRRRLEDAGRRPVLDPTRRSPRRSRRGSWRWRRPPPRA